MRNTVFLVARELKYWQYDIQTILNPFSCRLIGLDKDEIILEKRGRFSSDAKCGFFGQILVATDLKFREDGSEIQKGSIKCSSGRIT